MASCKIYPVSFNTIFLISPSNNTKDHHINECIWLLNANFVEWCFFPIDLFADVGICSLNYHIVVPTADGIHCNLAMQV